MRGANTNIRSSRLRDKIWILYITDSDPTPNIYRFKLRYPRRYISNHPRRIDLRAGDQIFFEPPYYYRNHASADPLQPFDANTRTRRIASSICVESRQNVLDLYPDTLKFRLLPSRWMFDESRKGVYVGTPDGAGCPECTLRYNASKDIILLHAGWEDQQAAIEIAKFNGSPNASFFQIRHVAIGVDDFHVKCSWPLRDWRTPKHDCRCTTEECNDHCKREPLPDFLSLFPLLQTFYVAAISAARTCKHLPGDEIVAGPQPPGTLNCPCPDDGLKHSWPMAKGSDICGRFAIYDERSGCSFPKFDKIEKIRQSWRPHFPYYRALDHLDIKFIQLYDPSSPPCSRCVYLNHR